MHAHLPGVGFFRAAAARGTPRGVRPANVSHASLCPGFGQPSALPLDGLDDGYSYKKVTYEQNRERESRAISASRILRGQDSVVSLFEMACERCWTARIHSSAPGDWNGDLPSRSALATEAASGKASISASPREASASSTTRFW